MKKQRKLIIGISVIAIMFFIIIAIFYSKNKMNIMNAKELNSERMTDSSRITELEKQIDNLNKEHTNYVQYIQTNKEKLATAITDKGVATSANDDFGIMANNIGKIESGITKIMQEFGYTGDVQEYTVIQSGIYRIKAYGAEGERGYTNNIFNGEDSNNVGAKGGKIEGDITLEKGQKLYVYVGGKPVGSAGGYNGGGKGCTADAWYGHGGGGGGATDIRIDGTELSNRAIVAGGGGGGSHSKNTWINKPTAGGVEDSTTNQILGVGTNGTLQQHPDYSTWKISRGGGGGGYHGGTVSGGGSNYADPSLVTNVVSEMGTNAEHGHLTLELLRQI